MTRTVLVALASAILLSLASPSGAATISIVTPLDGPQAGTASLATGTALVTIDDGTLSYDFTLLVSGILKSNVTGVHVHTIVDNSIVENIWTEPSRVAIPVTGGFALFVTGGNFQAALADLSAGKLYYNVHTTAYPAGEIRGNIVPEPGFLVTGSSLAGIGLIVLWRRRRRG
jgi:hypothetical protein